MDISRRTAVKGTAWSAPVILSSTVVPAYAASTCTPGTLYVDRATGAGYHTVNNIPGTLAWARLVRYFEQVPKLTVRDTTVTRIDLIISGDLVDKWGIRFSDIANPKPVALEGVSPAPLADGWSISADGKVATYTGPALSPGVLERTPILYKTMFRPNESHESRIDGLDYDDLTEEERAELVYDNTTWGFGEVEYSVRVNGVEGCATLNLETEHGVSIDYE